MPSSKRRLSFSSMTQWTNRVEEGVLVFLLALLTGVYVYNILVRTLGGEASWVDPFVRINFAWLVLFGVSYGFKNGIHVGVDMLHNALLGRTRKMLLLLTAFICIVYALIYLQGSWAYWYKGFSGFVGKIPVDQNLNYPFFETPVRRWHAYLMLPVSMAWLLWRTLVCSLEVYLGKRHSIIQAHELENEDALDASLITERR